MLFHYLLRAQQARFRQQPYCYLLNPMLQVTELAVLTRATSPVFIPMEGDYLSAMHFGVFDCGTRKWSARIKQSFNQQTKSIHSSVPVSVSPLQRPLRPWHRHQFLHKLHEPIWRLYPHRPRQHVWQQAQNSGCKPLVHVVHKPAAIQGVLYAILKDMHSCVGLHLPLQVVIRIQSLDLFPSRFSLCFIWYGGSHPLPTF